MAELPVGDEDWADTPAADTSSGMPGVMSGLDVGAKIVGFGFGQRERKKARKQRKKAHQEWERNTTDLGYRREATYRYERGRINNAIASMYKARGWELPTEQKPGAFTTRALPGEGALYPEDTKTYPTSEAKEIVGQMPESTEEDMMEAPMEESEEIVGDMAPEAPDTDVVAEEAKDRRAFTGAEGIGATGGGDIIMPDVATEGNAPSKINVAVDPDEYKALQLLRRRTA